MKTIIVAIQQTSVCLLGTYKVISIHMLSIDPASFIKLHQHLQKQCMLRIMVPKDPQYFEQCEYSYIICVTQPKDS